MHTGSWSPGVSPADPYVLIHGDAQQPPDKEPPRWLWWVWIGLCAAYAVIGVLRVAASRERFLGVVWLFQGVVFGLLGVISYLRWRRERERANPGSAGAKVERRPESRPGETP
jgi:hypothetical protein